MRIQYIALLALASAAIGGGITRVYFTKTVQVETIKERTKTVERIVTAPDGTRTEERIIEENKDEKRKTETAAKAPDWFIGAGIGYDRTFSGFVHRRVLGPIYVGGSLDSKGTALVTVGVEF